MSAQIKPNGEKIKELRIKKGWNLRDLAIKAKVNAATISNLENSKRATTPKTAKAIVSALEMEFDDLFFIVKIQSHKNNQ